ncbi:threonine/serine dehydratase [Aquabacter sp. L1I39]|uniref:threonine ammonia-lyase n=1 Tax=Aquabacter sp. L1I39 TaxID=2820278 RepID=UPI001ADA612C|nr:threonine/serine dehydratase [Aquabacter sp. L1I39]QTL04028.1 threonine/serine dehydratase [Aquabacter sp. L1I39]
MNPFSIPTRDDILDARRTLAGVAVETPLLRSDALDRLTGARVLLKCENLQRTGAFKFRGAYNCLSRLDRAAYPGGVVAYSTGNHGQAVATVARMLDLPATIVMPQDAPAVKIAKARAAGAQIVLYDRNRQSREEIAAEIAGRTPVAVVPPGDHRHIIAGQATVTMESIHQMGGLVPDVILVPCGGGGLSAGTCLAVEAMGVRPEVWAVEPEDFDDTRRSLASGMREVNAALSGSLCDALLAPIPAELPFSITQRRLAGALTASDVDVLRAIRFAYEELRLVTEPGGIIALAALLADPARPRGKTALIIISGGNVDPAVFKTALDLDLAPLGSAA